MSMVMYNRTFRLSRFWSSSYSLERSYKRIRLLCIVLWLVLASNMFTQVFSVKKILIDVEDRQYLESEYISELLASYSHQPLWDVDLDSLRQQIYRYNQIKYANLELVLPDIISIDIETYQPVARNSENQLVSSSGKVYSGISQNEFLPIIRNMQDGGRITSQLASWVSEANTITSRYGQRVVQLIALSDDQWRVFLSDGVVLIVEAYSSWEHFERFLRNYQNVKSRYGEISSVDLRYQHGVAFKLVEKSAQQIEEGKRSE